MSRPDRAARSLNLADVLEVVADAVPERVAIATIDRDYTYAEIDERSTRLANHLVSIGVRRGDHVAVHSANRIEWVDAFYGCFKARAVPININFRYLQEELAYLYDNADCVAAIVAPEHLDALAGLDLPQLRERIVLGEEYDAALAAASTDRLGGPDGGRPRTCSTPAARPAARRASMWRHEDMILAALNASRFGAPIDSVEQLGAEAAANESPMVLLAGGPLMHGGSQWTMGNGHVSGATVALYTQPSFEADQVLDLVQKAGVNSLTFLGDAMGRPVARAILERARAVGPVQPGRGVQRRRAAVRGGQGGDQASAAGPLHPRHVRRFRVWSDRVPGRRRKRWPARRAEVRGGSGHRGVRRRDAAVPGRRRTGCSAGPARCRWATTRTR